MAKKKTSIRRTVSPPVVTDRDMRAAERAERESAREAPPDAPDGVSGEWE